MGACVGRLHPPRSRGKTYASGNSERKAVPAASQKISGQDRLLLPYLCPSNTRPCGNLEEQTWHSDGAAQGWRGCLQD